MSITTATVTLEESLPKTYSTNGSQVVPNYARWLSWISFFFLAGMFTHVFGGDGEAGSLSGLFTPIAFSLYVLSILALMTRPLRARLWYYLSKNRLHLITLAFIVFSATWSLDPAATLRRAGALIGTTACGVLVGFCMIERGLLNSLRTGFLWLILVSAALAIVFPIWGTHTSGKFEGVWRGVLSFKNQFGWLCAVFVILWASQMFRRKWHLTYWIAMLIGITCLYMSGSATSLIVTTFGVTSLALLALYYRTGRYRLVLVFFAVLLVVGVVPLASEVLDSTLEIVGRDASLTGRTSIWETLWLFIEPNLWLGNGYSAFWDDAARYLGPTNWMASIGHSHNAYIELVLDIGVIGLTLALLFVASLALRLHRLSLAGDRDAIVLMAILASTLVIAIAGSLFFRPNAMAWFLFIIASAYATERRRQTAPRYATSR